MSPRTRLHSGCLVVALALVTASAWSTAPGQSGARLQPAAPALPLPNREGSLKFAVLGDWGDGSRGQRELAVRMAAVHQAFPFELVITVGDNIYGTDSPRAFRTRFEVPYKPLLDAGVKFYASLGNHDTPEIQRNYKLFNMEGRLYYSFKAPEQDVRFFALETTYLNLQQIAWIEKELQGSGEAWKITYFHHPLYSSGERHGSRVDLRRLLEPLFIKYNVSVVFAGHDHFYERVLPQQGIVHFVTGSGGRLREGNIDRRSGLTAKGFDTDRAFLVAEIDDDELFFAAVAARGAVVDSGVVMRRQPDP
ncbi:MAG TPA: metallophosphoesterase [Vicinamibacterales bacterium]|nr:metallophosphoesterase [Vicinamibacterales bacterium]